MQTKQFMYRFIWVCASGALVLLWSIKLILIPALVCCVVTAAGPRHTLRFPQSLLCPPQGESGGLDSPGCPRIVGSIQALTNVCRMYLEGCEIFSSFCAVPLFSFNLTISLSLSPDCIRIDCNLSKCLLCSIYCILVMSTCSRLWYNPVPLAHLVFWGEFLQLLKLQILLRHRCFNHQPLQCFFCSDVMGSSLLLRDSHANPIFAALAIAHFC